MQPFLFGKPEEPLFGSYDPPIGPSRERSVLLCYPVPQEYMRCHWAIKRLAVTLARKGFHVLRFDYFGTGDSSGESSAGNPSRWLEDIQTAAQELRDLSGAQELSAVGLRFGAALLAMASPSINADQIVLWEPIFEGKTHIEMLRKREARTNAFLPRAPKTDPRELFGLPFPAQLEQAISAIQLQYIPPIQAQRVSVVSSDLGVEKLQALQEKFGRSVPDFTHSITSEKFFESCSERVLISNQVLATIADFLEGAKL